MICLDTNYLIRGVSEGTAEAAALVAWIEAGETLITPMPAWFEFICVPFAEAEAVEAARLFNVIKRKRSLRVDAMIAGTAIAAKARLATQNRADFKPFTAYGLTLV